MHDIVELRCFLRSLCGAEAVANRVPTLLRAMARRAARGNEQTAHDLLNDVCVDLLERRGQAGSVERLLCLPDLELKAALRRRLVQVRSMQGGSRARFVKALRAHVAAALASPLPSAESLPVSLLKRDRLDAESVRQAVTNLRAEPDCFSPDVRGTAAELMSLYFRSPERDLDEVDANALDHEVACRIDAHAVADELRTLVGTKAVEALNRRARGLTHVGGGVAASTAHGRLAKALSGARSLVRKHDLAPSDFDAVMEVLAA